MKIECHFSEEPPRTLTNTNQTQRKMEPGIGFEPTTYALRMRCSTN